MVNVRVHSGRLTNLPAKGKITKRPRKDRSYIAVQDRPGRPAIERVEAFAPVVRDMVAAGFTREQIRQHVCNPYTGQPVGMDILLKLYRPELELGMDLANLAVSQSAFKQAVGDPGIPNPTYQMWVDEEGKPVPRGTPKATFDKRMYIKPPVAPVPLMTQWWEKTRAGKKEGVTHENVGANGQPVVQQLVIVLPSNGRDYGSQPVLNLIARPGEPHALPAGSGGSPASEGGSGPAAGHAAASRGNGHGPAG